MSPPQSQEETHTGKCSWVCTSTLVRQDLSLTSHSPSYLSLQSVGITGVHAQAGQSCFYGSLSVFSDLPYLPLESPVCLPLGVCSRLAGGRSCPACLQSCGWSPEQRGKGRKKRRFPQDFLTVSLAQFSLYSVISFLPKSISPGFYSLYLPFKM